MVIPFELDKPSTYINPLGSISKVEAVSYKFPPKFQEFVAFPYVSSRVKIMKSACFAASIKPSPTT